MVKKLSNKNQALLALGAAAAIGVFLYTRKKDKVAGIGGGVGAFVKTKETNRRQNERDFAERAKKWKREDPTFEIYKNISDVLTTDIDLKKGDLVSFTNDYGVTFSPFKVLGFQKPDKYGGCVFIDSDAFWFPHKITELTKL